MADENNTIKTKVELDSTQAQIEIAKLNSKASDSTKTLEERIEAKNKEVEVQDKLSKKTIANLEKEIDTLKKVEGQEKKVAQLEKKLNSERIKATKISLRNEKAQNKLNKSLEDSGDSTDIATLASEKFGISLKALAANPIVLVLTAIVGVFKLLQEAVQRSGKASETFSKIASKLSGVFNGVIAVLEPLVEFIGEKLLYAIESPGKAIKELGDTIKENLINRIKSFLVFGEAFTLLMQGEFEKATKKGADAILQLATGVEDATDKLEKFGEGAKKAYEAAASATEALANKERRLLQNRIALEKEQLKSLRLAEEERQIRDDVSKTIDERIEANRRLGEILDKQSKKELDLAQQALTLARQEQAASGDKIENLEAVGDAELKVLEIRERITGQRSEQLVNEVALDKEKKDLINSEVEARSLLSIEQKRFNAEQITDEQLKMQALRALLEEEKLIEIERLEAKRDGYQKGTQAFVDAQNEINAKKEEFRQREVEQDAKKREQDELDRIVEKERKEEEFAEEFEKETLSFEERRELLSERRNAILGDEALTEEERTNMLEENAESSAMISQLESDSKSASLQSYADAAKAVTSLIGEETAAGKALAVATTGVETYLSAQKAYSSQLIPGDPSSPIRAQIAAGVAIAGGLANVKKILSVKVPKSKGGGAAAGISGSAGATTSAITDISANNASRLGIDSTSWC